MNNERYGFSCLAILGALVLFVLLFLWQLQPNNLLGYAFVSVGSDETGVRQQQNQFVEQVGPNFYTAPFDLGADMIVISLRPFAFALADQEVLTNKVDQQLLQVDMTFNVRRPATIDAQRWQNYKSYYVNDDVMKAFVDAAAKDALRGCFNDSTFQEAVGGEGRTSLSQCIQLDLENSFEPSGLRVDTIFITNIDPSDAAMQKLEEIRAILQERDASNANADLAQANVRATSVVIEAGYDAIATQSAARIDAINAEANAAAAQATADGAKLLYQQAQALINEEIAQIQARANRADEAILAKLYQDYPAYAQVVTDRLLAESLANVQWGYLQPGQSPLTVITGADGTLGYVVPSAPGFAPTATPPAQ